MKTRTLVNLALVSALAYVLMLVFRIPIVPVVSFLTYEPKDIVIVIAGFIYGPMAVLLISLVVSFIEMFTASGSGLFGFGMNVASTCAYACMAAFIYQKMKSVKGAVIGLIIGSLTATITMVMLNYSVTPLYFGYPREIVAAMLLPGYVPFNLLKTGINSACVFLIYKPLVRALRKADLIPQSVAPASTGSGSGAKKISTGVFLVSGFVLIVCVLLILAMQGII